MKLTVRIERGPDRGQNFGSLFEARTTNGAAVVGGGFQGVYNTFHRTDRHVLQFFVRPTRGESAPMVEALPRPTRIAGTYLSDLDGTVYSSSEEARSWDESAQEWRAETDGARERMRLGPGMMTFDGGSARFNGRELLAPPDLGEYQRFYYAHDHLFFYHTYWASRTDYRLRTTDDEGFSKLYACPWRPTDGGGVDLDRAEVISLPVVGETPFSYGQFGDEVLTCSNIGGVYVFDGSTWRTAVEPEIGTSYQVYSMVNYYDRLLLGQYPTGQLFEYAGEEVTLVEGWPPVMAGVSSDAREAQTMAIYGGNLYVGVWPWAELWRYSPDMESWSFVRRMFSHPPVTDETTHPYERECAALGIVANQWGQRITSLVPMGSSLMISTSAKSPTEWEPAFDFVGEGRWLEYGTVHRLTMPGSLSVPVKWTEGATRLDFVLKERTMAIVQDGDELASAPIDGSLEAGMGAGEAAWGRGVFGSFGGLALEGWVETNGSEN